MALKDDLEKIDKKVDKIDDRLDVIDTHLAVYNEQLKIHIKRTNILEEEHKDIRDHITMVRGALKLIASTGIILAIIKLIQVVNNGA